MSFDFIDEINKVHLIDNLTYMNKIPDNFLDLTLSSPPFYADDVYLLEDNEPEFGWSNYREYLDHLQQVIQELYRITKPGGRMVLILTNTPKLGNNDEIKGIYPIVFDTFQLSEEIGWTYYTEFIWNKTSPSYEDGGIFPPIPISFAVSHHDIICVWLKHGEPKEYGQVLKYPSVWTLPAAGPISEYNKVYNSFPNKLIEQCLELFSRKGDIVFDPYAGSGQVIRTAINNSRQAFGTEVDEKWEYLWNDINL